MTTDKEHTEEEHTEEARPGRKLSPLNILGWLLILITVGPVGMIGAEILADPEPMGILVLLGFSLPFFIGMWLAIRRR